VHVAFPLAPKLGGFRFPQPTIAAKRAFVSPPSSSNSSTLDHPVRPNSPTLFEGLPTTLTPATFPEHPPQTPASARRRGLTPKYGLQGDIVNGNKTVSMAIVGRTKHTFVHEALCFVCFVLACHFECASRVCFGVLRASLCFVVLRCPSETGLRASFSVRTHCASVCFVVHKEFEKEIGRVLRVLRRGTVLRERILDVGNS
jgi:hypothetical protein